MSDADHVRRQQAFYDWAYGTWRLEGRFREDTFREATNPGSVHAAYQQDPEAAIALLDAKAQAVGVVEIDQVHCFTLRYSEYSSRIPQQFTQVSHSMPRHNG